MAERWYGGSEERWRHDNRGPMDRAADEVRSWMGDDRAEVRRDLDKQRDDWRERERDRDRDRDYRSYGDPSPVRGYEPDYGRMPDGYTTARYQEPARFDQPRQSHGVPPHDRGFYGLGPRNYKRSDQRTLEDVCDRLTEDPRVDASNIEVRCEKGVVTLSGTVNSREQKRYAEDVVEQTLGVDDVNNNIRVSPGVIGTPGAPQTPLGLSPDVSPEPRRR